jgi:hypothetical protein
MPIPGEDLISPNWQVWKNTVSEWKTKLVFSRETIIVEQRTKSVSLLILIFIILENHVINNRQYNILSFFAKTHLSECNTSESQLHNIIWPETVYNSCQNENAKINFEVKVRTEIQIKKVLFLFGRVFSEIKSSTKIFHLQNKKQFSQCHTFS